jgi:hypothetical protein
VDVGVERQVEISDELAVAHPRTLTFPTHKKKNLLGHVP